MERWYLQITEKFLFWTFRRWKIRSFFQPKSWLKDDIYWLLKSSCSELFGDGKYDLFFNQKVDWKMIFTWSFWVFHDIPGPGKYGFLCSEGDRRKNDRAYVICKFVRGMKFVHGKRYIYFFSFLVLAIKQNAITAQSFHIYWRKLRWKTSFLRSENERELVWNKH